MSAFFEGCLTEAENVSGIPSSIILGKSRKEEHVAARWLLIYLLYRLGYGPKAIGRFIGVHHASVINAHNKIHDVILNPNYNPLLAEHFKKLST